jgi:hypothetical protein
MNEQEVIQWSQSYPTYSTIRPSFKASTAMLVYLPHLNKISEGTNHQTMHKFNHRNEK